MANTNDPSERELAQTIDVQARELARFTLRGANLFASLESLREARDALIAARSKLGKSATEIALAQRLEAAISEARDLVYHTRIASALVGK